MAHIAIPIPTLPGKQDIEIEVTINGKRQQLHYRVELFYWEDCAMPSFDRVTPDRVTPDRVAPDRVECIQRLLAAYDQDWTLYYIGSPTDDFVPITFVKREDLIKQRQLRFATA